MRQTQINEWMQIEQFTPQRQCTMSAVAALKRGQAMSEQLPIRSSEVAEQDWTRDGYAAGFGTEDVCRCILWW